MIRIVVVLHLFYQDLWSEISLYLKNIDCEFDLCISLCKEHDASIVDTIRSEYPKSRIIFLDNRGADIGPFFEWMNILTSEKSDYDYLLKIHSKKSLTYAKKMNNSRLSDIERYNCINPLIGSCEIVSSNLKILSKENVGMVGSKIKFIDEKNRSYKNVLIEAEKHMIYFMKSYGVSEVGRSFFSGSMFWCKYGVLSRYFSRCKIGIDYFQLGTHQMGNTAAHAGERFISRIFLGEKLDLVQV